MKQYNYISIHEILSRLTKHPLLQDITKEQVVSYLLDFISRTGYTPMYESKEDEIIIKHYRGVVPCNVVSINYVKDCNGVLMRAMTDVFNDNRSYENTWKLQGDVIYTSFSDGKVIISYHTIPTDEEGFPKLVDDNTFLIAFEAYVKKEVFGVLFDLGKIQPAILQHAEQNYAWAVGQLKSSLDIPDVSQMESIKRMFTSSIENDKHFNNGFRDLGNQEYLRRH